MVNVLGDIPPVGGYISLPKVIVMLVLIVPWLAASPWVHKDSRKVRAPQSVWSMALLADGVAGVVIWLLAPYFVLGLLFYLVLVGGTLGAYVVYRNGRVEQEEKVLTTEHLRRVFSWKKRKPFEVVMRVKLYGSDEKVALPPDPIAEPERARDYMSVQNLLHDILWYRASEAELTPAGPQARIRFIVDGVVEDRPPIPLSEGDAIIQYLKPISGMNDQERRRPQKGTISVDLADKPIDMELVTAGTTGGQRMQFRILQEFVQTHLDGLGLRQRVLGRVRELIKQPGLVLVAAKPGNGLTSTLYSLLREQDAYTKQIVSLESSARLELENIHQVVYGDGSRLAADLVAATKRDPDVLMVDQCPDSQTAELIRGLAVDKPVLLGVQAPDAFNALARWVKVCGDPAAAIAGLRAILAQVLIRKLCPTCRESYSPDPKMLAKANISPQRVDKFYQPPSEPKTDGQGNILACPTCHGSGYMGRTGVFELLEINDEVRQLVGGGGTLSQVRSACRKNKMLYLQEEALEKVIATLTSIKEVMRVTQPEKKA
jgi:type II secretory ATPase GspE/PulE/Tfp pilus assembly ATPase PilB-like protein